jgi:hypothetical protein
MMTTATRRTTLHQVLDSNNLLEFEQNLISAGYDTLEDLLNDLSNEEELKAELVNDVGIPKPKTRRLLRALRAVVEATGLHSGRSTVGSSGQTKSSSISKSEEQVLVEEVIANVKEARKIAREEHIYYSWSERNWKNEWEVDDDCAIYWGPVIKVNCSSECEGDHYGPLFPGWAYAHGWGVSTVCWGLRERYTGQFVDGSPKGKGFWSDSHDNYKSITRVCND